VIKRFKEDAGRIIYLTTEQSQRLLDAAKADFNPQLYPFIYIGLRTGMRKMEILGIRIENIDTQRKTIYVPTAKAGAREQPITHDLANYLDTHMHTLSQGSCWLFPSPKSKTGHTVEVRKAFRRVAIAAGLNPDEVVRHTLRHTAVSHLVQAGVDLPTVKRISGHKTLAMVEKYAHQSGNHIQSAMDQLEARYTNFSDTITPKLHKAENTGKEKIG
jgi:integrase